MLKANNLLRVHHQDIQQNTINREVYVHKFVCETIMCRSENIEK